MAIQSVLVLSKAMKCETKVKIRGKTVWTADGALKDQKSRREWETRAEKKEGDTDPIADEP